MIITRKIQLLIQEEDKEKYAEKWAYLRKLNNDVFRAANITINNLIFNDAFVDRIMLTDEDLKTKAQKAENDIVKLSSQMANGLSKEAKIKLKAKRDKIYKVKKTLSKEARGKMQELYLRSESTELYHLINKAFPDMPSCVSSSLKQTIEADYKNDWIDVKSGKRTVRTYRNTIPIPFMKNSMRFEVNKKEVLMRWVDDIVFKLNFGRDMSNNRAIMENVLSDEYKLSDSAIQIKDKKIFLLLVLDIPNNKPELNPNISVGVDLGIAVPAYCAVSEGYARLPIGNINQFLKMRMQMQARHRGICKTLKFARGDKGRKRKMEGMDRLKKYEKNWVKTYNHFISSQIIKFALDNLAGNIKLEFLKGFGEDEKNKFILRNWSYYQLQEMIKYKAEMEGIQVLFIDPYHTSQICPFCGHYEKGQRETQSVFICKNSECSNKDKDGLNRKVNADYVGALNTSRSEKYVSKKEDCEFFKREIEKEVCVL